MKKILIINDLIAGGGVENVLHTLALYLKDRYKVSIVTLYGRNKQFKKQYPSKIKFYTYKVPFSAPKSNALFKKFYSGALKLKRKYVEFILSKKYDIAIAIKEGSCMELVSNVNAKKRIGWIHVDYNNLHWTKSVFENKDEELRCMQKFNSIVCVSNAVKQSVIDVVGDPENLIVKYNPLNYKNIMALANEEISFNKPEKMLFVAVGRLAKEKNFSLLIKVCSELEKKYDFEMWIIGDGEEKEKLKELIKEENNTSVKLLGFQKNPYKFIKCGDCLVSSSLSESFGLTIQEAFVLDTPVISTSCPAVEETLNKNFGVLCSNSYEGLKEAMEMVLENPAVLKEFESAIKKDFVKENLYQKRLEDIIGVWE